MSKTLEELFKETSDAIQYNYELLEKCAKHEYPYDGMDEEGHLKGGENSKAWKELYSMIVTGEQTLSDLAKAMNCNTNPIKYQNVVKYEPVHRCRSCYYIWNINGECVCKSPKMNINTIRGGITSNCLTKFDSYLHYYLKVSPGQIGCRNFKEFYEEEETA